MQTSQDQHKLQKYMKAFIHPISICEGSNMRKAENAGESKDGRVKDDVRVRKVARDLKNRHQFYPEKKTEPINA